MGYKPRKVEIPLFDVGEKPEIKLTHPRATVQCRECQGFHTVSPAYFALVADKLHCPECDKSTLFNSVQPDKGALPVWQTENRQSQK